MSFRSWNSYAAFSVKVRHGNRYIHDVETEEFLLEVLRTSSSRQVALKSEAIFWRAQLGYAYQPVLHEGEEVAEEIVPLASARMKPLDYVAREGRANPKGMPYLYLATDKETAMSEVRPWVGSSISVGQFKLRRDIRVINCAESHAVQDHAFYFKEPDDETKAKVVWANIDRAFATPVTDSDNSSGYVPTQVVAEFFKAQGFDGLVYKSSLGAGFNVVLFNPKDADLLNCFLFDATKVNFSFEEVSNPYFVRNTGS